ncbi:MAG TPA: lipid-A-disaccharide synthase, partial [Deinococcales bacterium]|nr:lipid-A-disaccharide synthase [Deinococcales bacterium]
MGARLAREFLDLRPGLDRLAVPLVGRGNAYEREGIPVAGPRLEMPSGGFMLTSPRVLVTDLRAGFAAMSREQYRAVRAARADAVVVVGDVYALWAALRFAGPAGGPPPQVFQVQPLVSAYYQDGLGWRERLARLNRTTVDSFVLAERYLMRRARRVFVRDERSARLLRRGGVPHAEHAGNLMMDLVAAPERDLSGLLDGRPVLALLPGTREDYLFSLPLMLRACAGLPEVQALAAFAGDGRRAPAPPAA